MTDKKVTKVITIEEIKERAKGVVVEIPGWSPGETIGVRLRAIDMTPHIMTLESMPNALKNAAFDVFEKTPSGGKKGGNQSQKKEPKVPVMPESDMDDMKKMLPIIDAIAKECLVEPKWEEFQENYPLTMVQKMAIFEFAMAGVDSLESFRS